MSNVGKDVEQLELSDIAGMSVQRSPSLLELCVSFL